MRQPVMTYVLRSMGLTYGDGHELEPHSHEWGQLIFAVSGTMQVEAADALWLVPPKRALWAPRNVVHAIRMRGTVAMRTIYVPPQRTATLPTSCAAVEVDPLLRELILNIVQRGLLRKGVREEEDLARVFLVRLAQAERLILHLPMPNNVRLRAIVEALRAQPGASRNLSDLARSAGMSARTIQRRFLEETGMRFVEWRQRLKLIHAISALHSGQSVTEAGTDAGYATTSAFIAAFRQQIGTTPSRYVRSKAAAGSAGFWPRENRVARTRGSWQY